MLEAEGAVRGGVVRLGEVVRYRIVQPPESRVRAFVHHLPMRSIHPFLEWSELDELLYFPEAPGAYEVEIDVVTGRGEDAVIERVRAEFLVEQARRSEAPEMVRSGNLRFWAPNHHEASGISDYESDLLDAVDRWVPAGSTVYDVGANLGLYAVPLCRAVGADGMVFCFEPNPLCVAYLRANLELNACSRCRVLPVALAGPHAPHEPALQSVEFTINPANSLLGLSSTSPFFGAKIGQRVQVDGASLDHWVAELRLPAPDVLKIDVEGAEHVVLPGMLATLEAHRPLLLFEIHGPLIARDVLEQLDRLGYSYEDAGSGRHFENASALLERFDDRVRQIICHPSEA
ncbi:MAG: FkbM family methyltransferase [Acidobacteriota bacterium]